MADAVARASLTLKLDTLQGIINSCESSELKTMLENVGQSKGVVALVAQAIADNFRQEGPGWEPLKAQTIRSSVRSRIGKRRVKGMTDEQLLQYEAAAREKDSKLTATRQILRNTSLLFKSVTTPGAQGNIQKTQGTNLIWGTNLIYSAIHNYGGVIKNPGTKNGFGMGIKIPAHDIPIPKREYLVIRDEWKNRINLFAFNEMTRILKAVLEAQK